MSMDAEVDNHNDHKCSTVDDEAYEPTYAEAFPPLPAVSDMADPLHDQAVSSKWAANANRMAVRSSNITQVQYTDFVKKSCSRVEVFINFWFQSTQVYRPTGVEALLCYHIRHYYMLTGLCMPMYLSALPHGLHVCPVWSDVTPINIRAVERGHRLLWSTMCLLQTLLSDGQDLIYLTIHDPCSIAFDQIGDIVWPASWWLQHSWNENRT